MIVTGIAPKIWEQGGTPTVPSNGLVHLAKQNLLSKRVNHVLTGLSSSWDFALALAAIEIRMPFSAMIPYYGYEQDWEHEERLHCHWILRQALYVEAFAQSPEQAPTLNSRYKAMVERSNLVLILWNYEDRGLVYQMMKYALRRGIQVTNLEQDWFFLQEPWPQVTDFEN